MSTTDRQAYLRFIPEINRDDHEQILAKDRDYGGSWKKRGGVEAAMNVTRKIDRLEVILERHGWDIFAAMRDESGGEAFRDTLGDLRRYLILVEAEVRRLDQAYLEATPEVGRIVFGPEPETHTESFGTMNDRLIPR